MRRFEIYPDLTIREREVITFIASGLSSSEIACEMGIATDSVNTHIRNIMIKLELHNRVQLAVYAFKSGLAHLEDIDLENIQQRKMVV